MAQRALLLSSNAAAFPSYLLSDRHFLTTAVLEGSDGGRGLKYSKLFGKAISVWQIMTVHARGADTCVTRSFAHLQEKQAEPLSSEGGLAYIEHMIRGPKPDLACCSCAGGDRQKIHFSNMGTARHTQNKQRQARLRMMLPEEWLEGSHSIHSQDMSPALPVRNAAARPQPTLDCSLRLLSAQCTRSQYSMCSLTKPLSVLYLTSPLPPDICCRK